MNAEQKKAAFAVIDEPARFRIVFGLIVVLLCALWAVFFRQTMLEDPDTWWHIKTGTDIWHSRTFPAHDTYSHTFYGQPWIAKEWLSQIILYLSYTAAGWNGVSFIAAVSVCLLGGLMYSTLTLHLRPVVAATIIVPSLVLASITFLARPHTLTLALIVMWSHHLFEAARQSRSPNFGLLTILLLWANLHAGFTLGFVIAFFAFLDFLERTRLANRPALMRWIIFLVLCPVVTLIHPYSYQAILMTFTVVGPNEALSFIEEWQPFNAPERYIHEAALLAMVFALLVSGVRFTFAKSLFIVLILHMFLVHIRFSYVLFPLLPVVIASDIVVQFPKLSAAFWRSEDRDPFERALARAFKLSVATAVIAATIISVLFLRVLTVKPVDDVAARGAIAYAMEHKLSGNVLNSGNFGGPLIFHGIPTYIDGRTDQLFLGGFITGDEKMQKPGGEKLFLEALENFEIQWTLLMPADARILILDGLNGWRRAYSDEFAVIHIRVASPS
jgi:hypothetical protein